MSYLGIFISFVVCALGQPSRLSLLGLFAAFIGYGVFWFSIRDYKRKLAISFAWFFCISLVQLSWLSDPSYCTKWIWLVYIAYSGLLAFGFTLGSRLVFSNANPLFVAAMFTMLEWLRGFILTGLPFSPAGLHLSTNFYAIQLAAYFGVLGLSFWVYLTNSTFYQSMRKKNFTSFGFLCLFPLAFGFIHHASLKKEDGKILIAAMVQTKTAPWMAGSPTNDLFISKNSWENWQNVLSQLVPLKNKKIDLIALPEGAFVFPLNKMFHFDDMKQMLVDLFGSKIEDSFPSLNQVNSKEDNRAQFVNAAFAYQTIANFFNADFICSIDDLVSRKKRNYVNAAFLFKPHTDHYKRYEKRLLVPLVEYFPFDGIGEFAKQFGIQFPFEPGKEAKIFQGNAKYGISICYEEVFSHIGRSIGKLQPDTLLNISNDVWFPRSNLAEQQRDLARLRSVELGVPSLRCNNYRTSGSFDRFGQKQQGEWFDSVFVTKVKLNKHPTMFLQFGDTPLLLFCALLIAITFVNKTLPLALNRKD